MGTDAHDVEQANSWKKYHWTSNTSENHISSDTVKFLTKVEMRDTLMISKAKDIAPVKPAVLLSYTSFLKISCLLTINAVIESVLSYYYAL